MVIINLFAVLAYVASVAYVIRKHTAYFPFFAFLSVTHLWALVSCFYNDLGIYNIELFRFTDSTLATAHLAMFYIVFNLGFVLTAKLIGKRVLTRRDYGLACRVPGLGNFKLLVAVAVAAIVVYDAFSLVTNGIPLLTGVDRETFTEKAGLVNALVVSWGPWIAFFLGMTRREGRRRHVQSLLVALMIVHAILTGHKFSLPYAILIFYYLPIIMRHAHRNPHWNPLRLRYLFRIAAVCLLFGSVVYGTYAKAIGNHEIASFVLRDRLLALQGEMWWAVDKDRSDAGTYDKHHWKDELTHLISPTEVPPEKVGMRYLMVRILGPEKAYAVFDADYLYTMAYPAILIPTFPYLIALSLQLLAGAFIFVLIYYVHFSFTYGHKGRVMLALLVLFPFTTMLVTGNFVVFFTLGMLVKITTLICLESVPLSIPRWPRIMRRKANETAASPTGTRRTQNARTSIPLLRR